MMFLMSSTNIPHLILILAKTWSILAIVFPDSNFKTTDPNVLELSTYDFSFNLVLVKKHVGEKKWGNFVSETRNCLKPGTA